MLKKYFKHPLGQEKLGLLADERYLTAQDLWLEACRTRLVTEKEVNFLVGSMPWNFLRHFPVKLPDSYVSVLFAKRNPQKIIAYCRDLDLPERFERLLIEKYQQSLIHEDEKMTYSSCFEKTKINGWKEALFSYLEGEGKRLTALMIQQKLLDMRDMEIILKLVARATIADKFLHPDIVRRLIQEHKTEAVKLLLRESYLGHDMKEFLTRCMPQFNKQFELAEYRRLWYEKERADKTFYGALTFTPYELALVLKHKEMSEANDQEFKETYIEPFIGRFRSCMRAYVAYYYPELAPQM